MFWHAITMRGYLNLIIHPHECQIYLTKWVEMQNDMSLGFLSNFYFICGRENLFRLLLNNSWTMTSSEEIFLFHQVKKGTQKFWFIQVFYFENKSDTNFTFSDADVTTKSLHYHIKITQTKINMIRKTKKRASKKGRWMSESNLSFPISATLFLNPVTQLFFPSCTFQLWFCEYFYLELNKCDLLLTSMHLPIFDPFRTNTMIDCHKYLHTNFR